MLRLLLLVITTLGNLCLRQDGLDIYVFLDEPLVQNDPLLEVVRSDNGSNFWWLTSSNVSMLMTDLLVNGKTSTGSTPESTVFLDLRSRPSSYVCNVAEILSITYMASTMTKVPDCTPVSPRLTMNDYVQAIVEAFEYENEKIQEIIFLLDDSAEFDVSVFERKNDSFLEVMMFQLRLPSQALEHYLTDGNTQLLVAMGTYASANNFLSKVMDLGIHRQDYWAFTMTDSLDCPVPRSVNMTQFAYICYGHHHDRHNNLTMKEIVLKRMMELLEPQEQTNQSKSLKSILSTILLTKISVETVGSSMIEVGNWTKTKGLQVRDGQTLYGPIPPPVLRVVLIHEPPFIIKEETANGTTYQGYTIDVLNEISRRLGFEYVATEVRDKQYGVKLPDGTWTGIIGEVASGISDVGVGPISVTAERESVIDFSAPYYDYAGLQILMKDPQGKQPLFIFANVFTEYVWLAWFSILIGTAFLLYGYHRVRNYVVSKHEIVGTGTTFDLKDSFWFVMASITLAGPERSPVTISSRLLVAGFWFFCQIMMATYTANLAAFMTSSRLNTPIESLEDLASQSGIRYSTLAGSVSETYFKRMANIENNFYSLWKDMSYYSTSQSTVSEYAVWDYPLGDRYSKILSVINATGFVNTSRRGIEKVMEGNFAYVHETPLIKYEMSRTCGLMTVGSPFSSKPYAFVLPENSPMADQFSTVILELQSETILVRLKEKWWNYGNSSCSGTTDESNGLTLETLGGIFIVTAGGCVLGYIILGVEIFSDKMHKQRKSNRSNEACNRYEINGNSAKTLKEDKAHGNDVLQTSSSQAELLY